MITLSAKPVVDEIKVQLRTRVERIRSKTGHPPKLSVVLVGEDPASMIYTRRKGEMAHELGIEHETIRLPSTSSPAEVKATIQRLNSDNSVSGILIQRPLPNGFKEDEVLFWISPGKDVDAFHPENAGRLFLGLPCFRPCTPAGVISLLNFYKIPIAGKLACVIGRSSIVGKPMASLLLQKNATVIQCHSKTLDLPSISRQADILIVAAGKPGLVDETYVKNGAVVVDVGIHRNSEGKVVGDVLFNRVTTKVSAITPVPGGVGPMTIMTLMQNTLDAAEHKQ